LQFPLTVEVRLLKQGVVHRLGAIDFSRVIAESPAVDSTGSGLE